MSSLLHTVSPDWARALEPVRGDLEHLASALANEAAHGHTVLPAPGHIMRAFERPLVDVRVLIVGQDPYPTPGHAHGLSFSTAADVRPLPRSLANIMTELRDDVGVHSQHGDLSAWADQGVMLLNRVLTVRAGQANSHARLGWQRVTEHAVRALAARDRPLVAVLWGRHAQTLAPLLSAVPTIESAHPSPLSARRGFFGSRPFSRINALLVEQGSSPVDWALPR